MELLSVQALHKSFGANPVLRGVDLGVDEGSVRVLVGLSGSGKTTVLRSLHALEVPDAGTVRIGDVALDFAAPVDRRSGTGLRARSGMVFQGHDLFPHLTVLGDVMEGPLVVQKRPRDEMREGAWRCSTAWDWPTGLDWGRRDARDALRPGVRPVPFLDGGVVVERGAAERCSRPPARSAPDGSCTASSTRCEPRAGLRADGCYRAHRMQRVAAGRTSSRSGAMAVPHASQRP